MGLVAYRDLCTLRNLLLRCCLAPTRYSNSQQHVVYTLVWSSYSLLYSRELVTTLFSDTLGKIWGPMHHSKSWKHVSSFRIELYVLVKYTEYRTECNYVCVVVCVYLNIFSLMIAAALEMPLGVTRWSHAKVRQFRCFSKSKRRDWTLCGRVVKRLLASPCLLVDP